MMLDRFHHHDGVIHHDPDRQHKSEQRQRIDGETEELEEDERSDEGYRDNEDGDERGAPALQEDVHHDHHERQCFQERLDHFADGDAHEGNGFERHHPVDIVREGFFQFRHPRFHPVGHIQRVGAGCEVDAHPGTGFAISLYVDRVTEGTELLPRNVGQAHERPGVGVAGHDDIAKFFRGEQAAAHFHGIFESLVFIGRRRTDDPCRRLGVLLLDGARHHGGCEAEVGHLLRVQPDAHGVIVGKCLHVAHAAHAGNFGFEVDIKVVVEECFGVRAVRGKQGHHHEHVVRALFGGNAHAAYIIRHAGGGDAHAVLHVEGGNIRIGADLESDGYTHRAVVRAGRLQVHGTGGTIDLVLDGCGHGFFHGGGVGADITGAHGHCGRRNVGELGHRQVDHADEAYDHHDDGNHDRRILPFYERFRNHGAFYLTLTVSPGRIF